MQINYHQDMNQAVNDTIMALNYNYAPIYIQWNFKSPKKNYSKVIVLLLKIWDCNINQYLTAKSNLVK